MILDMLQTRFLANLTALFNDDEYSLLALPSHVGGLEVVNLSMH